MRRLASILVAASLVTGACTGGQSAAPPPTAPPSLPGAPSSTLSPEQSPGPPGSTGPPGPAGPPTGSTGSTGSTGPAYSTWELGAQVLPVGPDGYGVIRPTPPSLRVRRYPTADLLPPPTDGRFTATVSKITPAVRERMGQTWTPGCPVPLAGLRYVTVSFRGFDGAAHTGELVVAAAEATDVVSVFWALFDAGYPIEEMRLPGTADLDAPPTGDGNNTAGLVCRASTGGTAYSAHAYGLAIDLNPFVNPFRRDDLVLPERASSYLDRGWRRPGMLYADSLVVREFARIGWSWGGDFQTVTDPQHFTATGR